RALLDDAIQLRRRIHRHPEIGLTLPRTQAAVLEALDALGLETRTGQRTTSVLARLAGGKPGPTILLRADMDALPLREETGLPFASEVDGAMHACGHDAHVAMLVGAARVIVQAFQTLVTRRVNVFDPAVITIGKITAGTTRNVIPETAHLLGTVRTVSEVTRERVLEGIRRVADGIATAHGAEAAVELIRGYPVTSN